MKTRNKPERQAENNRRKFLVGATLGGVGAMASVAAVVSGGNITEAINVAAVEPAAKVKGYHETDHIRQYYETARF